MCAIIGYIGKSIEKSRFDAARDVLAHRGPDDAGTYQNAEWKIALGSRRLSIIDLSPGGHQPMHSADGRYVIIFNGEIFNYVELKQELAGYPFRSTSDTEVLLAAYATWGEECLKRLNGQFAFAIYDTREHQLFAARDHIGIKPFFYARLGGAFAFASEIKALLALGMSAHPNEHIIYEYLKFGVYDHRDETFFDGVQSLPPGHALVYHNSAITIKKYWDLADAVREPVRNVPLREASEQLQELVRDAIQLQFRSDVPVGINLTSGLDSGVLYYFSRRVYPAELHAFTGCIADDRYDECAVLRERLRPEEQRLWHTAVLRPEYVFEFAKELTAIEDQPYGGMPAIQFFNLYRATHADTACKVVIEGQGMDELLAGYRYYLPAYYRDAFTNLSLMPFREYFTDTAASGTGYILAARELIRMLWTSSGRSQDLTKESGFDLVSKEFEKQFQSRQRVDFPRPFRSRLLNDQYRDIRHTKIPRILRSNDHFSMAFGKEVRVPYLDRRIVEFCVGLAPQLKIHGKVQKFLMRNAMQPFLPDAMPQKTKVTFGAFQTGWFRKYFREEVSAFLGTDSFRSRRYFNQEAIQRHTDAFFRGEGDNSFFLWQIINLELWLKKFID